MSIKHNGAWCTSADLESAERSTAPFLTVLAQLISSAEKPERLNPRQMAQWCCYLASNIRTVHCAFFFPRLLPFFCLHLQFEQLRMKTCFEYCLYANYSQTCLSTLDISFSKLKSYFFSCFGLWGFFSVSLHGPSTVKACPKQNILFPSRISSWRTSWVIWQEN